MNNKMVNDYLMMPKDENICSIILIFGELNLIVIGALNCYFPLVIKGGVIMN